MPESSSSDFDIRHYWSIIQKRKYLALSVALVVISLFTWGSFLLPRTYEASSTVFIERSSIIDPLIEGVGVYGNIEERLINIKNGVLSRKIIERVIKKLDLDTETINSSQYEALIQSIKERLNVNIEGNRRNQADLFTISYKGKDPELVRDIVNKFVDEYIEENVGSRRTDVYSAYAFIKSQLVEYKSKLEESDKAIREFREKNPNMVPQSETTLLSRIERFQTEKIESEIQLKELTRKRENLQKQLSGEKELTIAFVSSEGSPQGRLNYLNNQLVILMTKFTKYHPDVIKVKSEIEELKSQIEQAKDSQEEPLGTETAAINPIYQQLREELTKTDFEIESVKARIKELTRQQQDAQRILGQMPKEQEEWVKLQRDRNVYQRLYDELLQKQETARVSKDLELTEKTGAFRVIDPAVLPQVPVSPNRVKLILMGIMLSIASGLGVAIGLEYLRDSFRDEASIEERLKLPVLATIPKIITEEERLSAKMLDKKVFTAAGIYLFIIGIILAGEFLYRYMGIKFI